MTLRVLKANLKLDQAKQKIQDRILKAYFIIVFENFFISSKIKKIKKYKEYNMYNFFFKYKNIKSTFPNQIGHNCLISIK